MSGFFFLLRSSVLMSSDTQIVLEEACFSLRCAANTDTGWPLEVEQSPDREATNKGHKIRNNAKTIIFTYEYLSLIHAASEGAVALPPGRSDSGPMDGRRPFHTDPLLNTHTHTLHAHMHNQERTLQLVNTTRGDEGGREGGREGGKEAEKVSLPFVRFSRSAVLRMKSRGDDDSEVFKCLPSPRRSTAAVYAERMRVGRNSL